MFVLDAADQDGDKHAEIVRRPEYMKSREFKFPAPEPVKSGRRIPVNVVIGPYGGYYNLE